MKKFLMIIASVALINILTGCWSRKELNELGIASALGIDKSEGKYLLTAQLMNVDEIGQDKTGNRTPVLTYRTTGRTLFEALRRMTLESPRKIYLPHIRVIVIGEQLAREGIADALDFLSRDHEFRTDFYILVAKDNKAETVLSMLTALEDVPADKIFSGLETASRAWAAAHAVQLDELISTLTAKGIYPTLTGVLISGSSSAGISLENLRQSRLQALLKIDAVAAFKSDRLVGWLTEEESMGFNAIMGNIKSSITTFTDPKGGVISIEVLRTSTKVTARVVDGKPVIFVEIRGEGNVGEVQADIDLTKNETIGQIEKMWAKTVEKRMEKVVKRAQQEFESDIFGFGETIHRHQPKAWRTLGENWDEEFKNLQVEVRAITQVKGLGTITNPIKKK